MSITLIELSEQLNQFANDLSGPEQANLMLELGTEALSTLKKRVTETGVNAEDEKYEPYSTRPILIGSKSFVQQDKATSLLGSKEKRKKLEWVTLNGHRLAVLEGGYKKLRELQNRQTAFVDFVFTGRLWGNIKLVSDPSELASGVAVIKATQELEKKKLSGLTEKKGEILSLSKKEETELTNHYNSWVEKLLKKNGFK